MMLEEADSDIYSDIALNLPTVRTIPRFGNRDFG